MTYILLINKGNKTMEKQALIEVLSKGQHLVDFTKKNGERVQRVVTGDPALIPEFNPKTDRVTKQSETTVRVWDVKNLKFISLLPENVISTN